MILLKHNAIENFASFTKGEKEDLIIQELSKAFMLYPRATADILDTCEIKYKSLKPKDLALAVEQGRDNLKMLNRIVRLSFLVNRKGDNTLKNHNISHSFFALFLSEQILKLITFHFLKNSRNMFFS